VLGFKYRVYPSQKQIIRLNRQMFLAKEMYNLLLEKSKQYYKETGKTFSQFDMNKCITQLKRKRQEFSEVHSQVLQNISKRISDAYKAFFRRAKEKKEGKKVNVGFPKVKRFVFSLTYPSMLGFGLKNTGKIYLSKIGDIPIVLHKFPKGEGKIKTCIIKYYPSGKWYVSFLVEFLKRKFKNNKKEQVGIDVGLKDFATLSNGEKTKPPKFFNKAEKRIKFLQRRLSRKKKGSKNRRKAKFKLTKAHEKVTNQRSDFLHKLSTKQVNSYSKIAIEKLSIQNMQKNHYLAKSIADASWGEYTQMLHYKAWSAGCEVIEVDPRNTTKICSCCGNIQEMPLSKRIYNCPVCGHKEDRDINAAKNILARATVGLTESYACGDLSSTLLAMEEQDISLKQELYGVRK